MSFSQKIYDLAKKAIEFHQKLNNKLVIVESCTGGLISAALTEISGSSAVLEGGFFAYSNEFKQNILGIDENIFIKHGAVSKEVAFGMAKAGLLKTNANVALSITGIAGPTGGTDDKPVGLVYICLYDTHGNIVQKQFNFGDLSREKVRQNSVIESLKLLLYNKL